MHRSKRNNFTTQSYKSGARDKPDDRPPTSQRERWQCLHDRYIPVHATAGIFAPFFLGESGKEVLFLNPNCKYEVQTRWGWFRLDEGAYQDYLAGKLWITCEPGKPNSVIEVESEYIPANVTKGALALRDAAMRVDAYTVLHQRFPHGTVEVPFRSRMSETPIDEMCMSVRSTNALMRAGAKTFGKLKAIMELENGLRSIRNLGIKSEKEIKLCFFNYCYSLLSEGEKAAWWQSVIDSNPSNDSFASGRAWLA